MRIRKERGKKERKGEEERKARWKRKESIHGRNSTKVNSVRGEKLICICAQQRAKEKKDH
jgi:hypothetical protein